MSAEARRRRSPKPPSAAEEERLRLMVERAAKDPRQTTLDDFVKDDNPAPKGTDDKQH